MVAMVSFTAEVLLGILGCEAFSMNLNEVTSYILPKHSNRKALSTRSGPTDWAAQIGPGNSSSLAFGGELFRQIKKVVFTLLEYSLEDDF